MKTYQINDCGKYVHNIQANSELEALQIHVCFLQCADTLAWLDLSNFAGRIDDLLMYEGHAEAIELQDIEAIECEYNFFQEDVGIHHYNSSVGKLMSMDVKTLTQTGVKYLPRVTMREGMTHHVGPNCEMVLDAIRSGGN